MLKELVSVMVDEAKHLACGLDGSLYAVARSFAVVQDDKMGAPSPLTIILPRLLPCPPSRAILVCFCEAQAFEATTMRLRL